MPHVEIPCAYCIQPEYPHMGPEDTAIWNRFVAAHPGRFLRVWYDFRVGDEDPAALDSPDCVRTSWWDLSYWRIDVVAEDEKAIYIIEVKPRANAKALGQALFYATLYEEDEAPAKPVRPVVLTDEIILTTQRLAALHEMELWKA